MESLRAEGPGWRLSGTVLPILTAATHAAGVEPVGQLTLTGTPPPEPLTLRVVDLDIRVQVPEAARRRPGGVSLSLLASPAPLERMTARQETALLVCLGERELTRVPITLLPSWHWPHARAARVAAASLVVPGDDAVSRAVAEACRQAGGRASRSVDRDGRATREILRALYEHLAARRVSYEISRTEVDPWSGGSAQRVRAPHEILPVTEAVQGRGNCLDLTLLLAGALESLSLDPLICFAGSLDEPPVHAFLGCWTTPGERFRPIHTDAGSLGRKVERGELLVVEPTGVCAGEAGLSFDDACGSAAARFGRGEPVHAVDVAATRPPRGRVRPLVSLLSPLARRARWLAEEFARDRAQTHVETSDLLYGLCAARGDLTTWLFTAAGSTARRVQEVVEASRGSGTHEGAPLATGNLELCLETARTNARAAGRPAVEESDLLWAVLENPSRNVGRILAAAGCPLEALKTRLEGRAARVYEQSVFRDPEAGAFTAGTS
jgi:hypothetical protein